MRTGRVQGRVLQLHIGLAGLVICAILQASDGQGAAWTVTSLANSGSGSLRAAIADASSGDLIQFAVSGTISLSGELEIDKDVAIAGPGPGALAISGNQSSRVLRIRNSAVASLTGVTICNGRAPDGVNGGDSLAQGGPGEDGGGIHNVGTLAVTNCVITGCRSGNGGHGRDNTLIPSVSPGNGGAGGCGGGIYNAGFLTMVACSLHANSCGAGGDGGHSRYVSHTAGVGGVGGHGGGIHDIGRATLLGCTVSSNSAGSGGIGAAGGTGDTSSPTGASGGLGGAGGVGGGISTSDYMALISSTICANVAGDGGTGGSGGPGVNGSRFFPDAGYGGEGSSGGSGGGGGGIHSVYFFRATACTIAGNACGKGGKGGQGGVGGTGFGTVTGSGGNGGNGGSGGGGGGGGGAMSLYSIPWMQNVLVAQNSTGAGDVGGAGGARGTGVPNGYAGFPGSDGFQGSGPDLLGPFDSKGHNLVGRAQGNTGFGPISNDIIGSGGTLDPLLGPLTDNGGPTLTRALLYGSPALEAGDDRLTESGMNLLTDERGLSRKSGVHVDIGAFELQWSVYPVRIEFSRVPEQRVILSTTNAPGASISVMRTTDPSQPIDGWTNLGPLQETLPGKFQYIDAEGTDFQPQFYRVRCP